MWQNSQRTRAIGWGSLCVLVCIVVSATNESYGYSQSVCAPLDQQVAIYKAVFCIPKSAGYEIRSADQNRIRFEEVYWIDGKRGSLEEFKAHRRSNKDGNDLSVALIASIESATTGTSSTPFREQGRAVFAAVTARQDEFLRGAAVSFDISSWCGGQTFQFVPNSDGIFVATVKSEFTAFCLDTEYWVVGTNYSGIDTLLRCSRARDLELSCTGGFEVGNARVHVSVFGKSVYHLLAAYKENRSIIQSFLTN